MGKTESICLDSPMDVELTDGVKIWYLDAMFIDLTEQEIEGCWITSKVGHA